MPFKLYNAPQSTCSQRVRFVLNAKGLPFAEHKLEQSKHDLMELALGGTAVGTGLNSHPEWGARVAADRKSTRLNSSHQ